MGHGHGTAAGHGFGADVFWREPDGRVTRMSSGDGLYLMACMHPTGSHAVCWGGRSGRPRLWVGDGSGTFEAITDGACSARYPAFNAAGDVLAYCRSTHPTESVEVLGSGRTTMPRPEAGMSIVVRAADGSWEREVTEGGSQDQRPALSPDGARVVFVSNRLAPYELWTARTDSGDPEPLLRGFPAYRPWWSVDGRHIFFFTLGLSRHRLYAIPATGGRPRPLRNDLRGHTHGPYADLDGRTLVAHSTLAAPPSAVVGPRAAPVSWAVYEFPLEGGPPRWLCRGAHGTRARNGVMTFDVRRSR